MKFLAAIDAVDKILHLILISKNWNDVSKAL
ncbi:hypothetical protein O9A_00338 [Bartonella koehlerae C-29]|uniref:Uncharacterized protein n=1 Tax=Bartonella koehlerae C-29 TaxID=1134510 RepID=A0A067WH53_9HYPH|nr:hypothetical protein O9A_00338 [Bartonella koehlerae C-29]